MPWRSSRCLSGSMSGTPLWCRSKCSPLGVIMPSSDSSGVREAPLPVVPGCERMSVRVTLLSYLAGVLVIVVDEGRHRTLFRETPDVVDNQRRDDVPPDFESPRRIRLACRQRRMNRED